MWDQIKVITFNILILFILQVCDVVIPETRLERGSEIDNEKKQSSSSVHSISTCEHYKCNDEVWAACTKCLCFLCYEHFLIGDPCFSHNKFGNLYQSDIESNPSTSHLIVSDSSVPNVPVSICIPSYPLPGPCNALGSCTDMGGIVDDILNLSPSVASPAASNVPVSRVCFPNQSPTLPGPCNASGSYTDIGGIVDDILNLSPSVASPAASNVPVSRVCVPNQSSSLPGPCNASPTGSCTDMGGIVDDILNLSPSVASPAASNVPVSRVCFPNQSPTLPGPCNASGSCTDMGGIVDDILNLSPSVASPAASNVPVSRVCVPNQSPTLPLPCNASGSCTDMGGIVDDILNLSPSVASPAASNVPVSRVCFPNQSPTLPGPCNASGSCTDMGGIVDDILNLSPSVASPAASNVPVSRVCFPNQSPTLPGPCNASGSYTDIGGIVDDILNLSPSVASPAASNVPVSRVCVPNQSPTLPGPCNASPIGSCTDMGGIVDDILNLSPSVASPAASNVPVSRVCFPNQSPTLPGPCNASGSCTDMGGIVDDILILSPSVASPAGSNVPVSRVCVPNQSPTLPRPCSANVSEVNPEDFPVDGVATDFSPKRKKCVRSKNLLVKEKRNSGEAYRTEKTDKLMAAKRGLMGSSKCSYCKLRRLDCDDVSIEDQKQIQSAFYDMGKLQRQRECIHNHMTSAEKICKNNRNLYSYSYFLPRLDAHLGKWRVCKNKFLTTLGITDKQVRTVLKKVDGTGVLHGENRGGRQNQQSDELLRQQVQDHIAQFPRMESHYCRANSKYQYLSSDLNLQIMYRMYQKNHPNGASLSLYRNVFIELNLKFHHPKKDMCGLCDAYRSSNKEQQDKLQDKYNEHIQEKDKVRQLKAVAKEKACTQSEHCAAVFDLEQVIYVPRSNRSELFYKRRLSCFNFTIYNLGNKDGHCFLAHEGLAKRGSSEIASYVHSFLKDVDQQGITQVDLFSDGCSGQNKNSIVPAMMLYFVSNSQSVQTVTLHFFEANHGQSEGDAIHSTVERALTQAGDIFVPSQLLSVPLCCENGKKNSHTLPSNTGEVE